MQGLFFLQTKPQHLALETLHFCRFLIDLILLFAIVFSDIFKNDSESCKALVNNWSDLKSHRAKRIASSLRLWPEFLLVTVFIISQF